MTTTLRSVDELVEEVVGRLTSEQLFAVAARLAAAEAREPEPERPFEIDASLALDIGRTIAHVIDLHRRIGVDDDLIASQVLRPILTTRLPEDVALDVIHRHTGWRPRTTEDRIGAVARGMLGDGLPPDLVVRAIDELRASC